MHFTPEKACKVTDAAVLHNLAKRFNLPDVQGIFLICSRYMFSKLGQESLCANFLRDTHVVIQRIYI